MILLLNPNPSGYIQNPKTNKQLILQKIVIPKGHNYSCSKRNNTKCPNLHKHVRMLRASQNCLNSKRRIQDRAGEREREREREREIRESTRERARERRVASAEVRNGFCEFYIRGGVEKCRKVRNAFCEFYIRGGGDKCREVRNAFCEFYIRGGDEKCRKVVGERALSKQSEYQF
jgi:hypothetical protein